jgi:hypothetical protein
LFTKISFNYYQKVIFVFIFVSFVCYNFLFIPLNIYESSCNINKKKISSILTIIYLYFCFFSFFSTYGQ